MASQGARLSVEPKPVARPKARSAEAARPAAERPTARESVREQVVDGYQGREYVGRDGEILRRKNPGYRNEFDFQPHEVPEKYEYQWIRHTVHGDPSESELWDMQENGWRPVPHERHANRFAPGELMKGDLERGKPGCILRKGQLLVERPKEMCDDARNEMKRAADRAIREQFGSHKLALPDNVQRMGLEPRAGRVNFKTDDVGSVKPDFMPKHELEIDG